MIMKRAVGLGFSSPKPTASIKLLLILYFCELGIHHFPFILLGSLRQRAAPVSPACALACSAAYIFSPNFCAAVDRASALASMASLSSLLTTSSAAFNAASTAAFSSARQMTRHIPSATCGWSGSASPADCARSPVPSPCGHLRHGLQHPAPSA